jgi:hypothetical protein
MPYSPAFGIDRRLLLVSLVLYDAEKSYVNAGMPEKS